MTRKSVRLFAVSLFAIALATSAFAGSNLWTYKNPSDIKWHKLSWNGNIIFGGDTLACIDAQSGQAIWTRADLNGLTAYQVSEVEGSPYLLVTKNSMTGTKLSALNVETGKTFWETEKLKGATIGVFPHPTKDLVLILTSGSQGQGKTTPDMIMLNLNDGNVVWEQKFADKVDLHQADQRSRWSPHYDLSGHQPPIFEGDAIYFTYGGAHRYDVNTGKMAWAVPYDVTEGRLKRANAQAVIDGDLIYTSAKGQLRAVDKNTGIVKWISKDYGAGIAEMQMRGNIIYGRMGGTFFDDKKNEWDLKKPLGIVAISTSDGQPTWRYDKMKDSITNILMLDEQKTILIADKDEVVGLSTNGQEAFRQPINFKHKAGGGEKAMKVARFGLGGLKGGLKGMSDDKKMDDVPVNITMMPGGLAVVRGKQHVIGFDPSGHQVTFANAYEAPGFAGWQKFAMISMTAMSYTMNTAGAASTSFGSSSNTMYNNSRQGDLSRMSSAMSKRFSSTKAAGKYVYMLTQVEEGKDKGAGLVAVELANGELAGQVLLRDKEPDYVVDELNGQLYNLRGNSIEAYSIRTTVR
jgi:outer membrane protein assembly factor BamB